jgi:hypothetical protein
MVINLKSVVSIALFAVTSSIGLMPIHQAQAEDVKPTTQQLIRYECYDRSGNIAYVTTNPQETIGWQMGCREVPYISEAEPRATYYQCYDGNGNIVLTTTDRSVDNNLDNCRRIGYRDSTPTQIQPVYYECLNSKGEVAFSTVHHQDTQGWVPDCREVRTITPVSSPDAPR